MSFKPIQKLDVVRTLSTGLNVSVGTLAQNSTGVYFQYHPEYLDLYGNISPFLIEHSLTLQKAPNAPHEGLQGIFADSLPDGWGRLLQDRIFRQHNIAPYQITPMDSQVYVRKLNAGA